MEGHDGKQLDKRVPKMANRSRETHGKWWWVEPTVWTEHMLAALDNGVKGGKWYSLMDKVYRRSSLEAGYEKVAENKGSAGIDRQSVVQFGKNKQANIERLETELRLGSYQPRGIRRVWIDKPGKKGEKRPLGIPVVRDRTVQASLKNVLEPIFEAQFSDRSYGFRPGRGCKDALREVDRLLKAGYTWVVDADIKSYFDSISHERLMSLIEETVADGRVLHLLRSYLKQEVMESLSSWTPEKGTPQGAVVSPLLANIYLNPLDHHMTMKGYEIIRYADDFVIMCRTEEEGQSALREVASWLNQAELRLHPEKTRLVDETKAGGFDFLGYHFERGMKWPRKSSLKKLRDKVRSMTKRTNGNSMENIVTRMDGPLRGWFGYFKHSKKTTFTYLDGWIRMRLRSILRKRDKRKGRGRGFDHLRYPNTYFSKLGLFSLTAAHQQACQSAKR